MIYYLIAIGFAFSIEFTEISTVQERQVSGQAVDNSLVPNKNRNAKLNRQSDRALSDPQQEYRRSNRPLPAARQHTQIAQPSGQLSNPTAVRPPAMGQDYTDRTTANQSTRRNRFNKNYTYQLGGRPIQASKKKSAGIVKNSSPVPPKTRTRSFIKTCRSVAMKLELLAGELEEIENYRQADKLRAQARELRLSCRNVNVSSSSK